MALVAMDKITMACTTHTEAREACEAAAPRGADKPWGDKEEKKMAKASKALDAAKERLVKATQALQDSTAASAELLGSADDVDAYRERKEKWNAEVDTLAHELEEAAN